MLPLSMHNALITIGQKVVMKCPRIYLYICPLALIARTIHSPGVFGSFIAPSMYHIFAMCPFIRRYCVRFCVYTYVCVEPCSDCSPLFLPAAEATKLHQMRIWSIFIIARAIQVIMILRKRSLDFGFDGLSLNWVFCICLRARACVCVCLQCSADVCSTKIEVHTRRLCAASYHTLRLFSSFSRFTSIPLD